MVPPIFAISHDQAFPSCLIRDHPCNPWSTAFGLFSGCSFRFLFQSRHSGRVDVHALDLTVDDPDRHRHRGAADLAVHDELRAAFAHIEREGERLAAMRALQGKGIGHTAKVFPRTAASNSKPTFYTGRP